VSGRREIRELLEQARPPDERGAEERGWRVIRTAYAERGPAPVRAPRRRLLLAAAGGLALLAIGLSPAGARVGELVEDVVGIADEDARPSLRSLPAAGEILVETGDGVWIVRADGSKRRLGDYEQASWSPRGLFVVAAAGRELVAVDPLGDVRWTVSAPAPVSDPRWSPSGYRIAYRSGDDLRVVAGDGTGDHLVARDVAPVAPAWQSVPEAKVTGTPGGPGVHLLTYLGAGKKVETIDVDTGRRHQAVWEDAELAVTSGSGDRPIARSPDGRWLARIVNLGARTRLFVERPDGSHSRLVFSGPGHLTGPTWSPDGRWVLVGWRNADQWLFIRPDRPRRIVAIDRISAQFDPGGDERGGFPRVSGWILPAR
jgi:hypothetical protein